MSPRHSHAAPTPTDDFKRIKGIGRAVAGRLHAAGLNTFAELGALTVEQLAALVPRRSASQLAEWLKRAQQLASPPRARAAASTPLRHEMFTMELQLDQSNQVTRTLIENAQHTIKDHWDEWDESRLIEFIAAHAKVKRPLPPAASAPREAAPVTPKADASPCRIELGEFQVEALTGEPGQRLQYARPGTHFMRAQLKFMVAGSEAQEAVARHSRYFAQVLACDLLTGQALVLASIQRQLGSAELLYRVPLEFATPPAGRYQLFGLVLLPEEELFGFTAGPRLTIIPWVPVPSAEALAEGAA